VVHLCEARRFGLRYMGELSRKKKRRKKILPSLEEESSPVATGRVWGKVKQAGQTPGRVAIKKGKEDAGGEVETVKKFNRRGTVMREQNWLNALFQET